MALIEIIKILVDIVLLLLGSYFLLGLLFGLFVFISGGEKVDPLLKENSWKLRLLILPGLIAIWPFLVMRLFKNKAHE